MKRQTIAADGPPGLLELNISWMKYPVINPEIASTVIKRSVVTVIVIIVRFYYVF